MKRILFFILVAGLLNGLLPAYMYSQNSGDGTNPFLNEATKKMEEESYRTFTFLAPHLSTDADVQMLKNILRSSENILSFDINPSTKKCIVNTKMSFQKSDLVTLLGTNEIKTAEYTQEVHMVIQPAVVDEETHNRQQMERQQDARPQAGSERNGNQAKLPTDFPKYIDTGNPQTDNAEYAKAKAKWIQENPERYKQLFTPRDSTLESKQQRQERLDKENFQRQLKSK